MVEVTSLVSKLWVKKLVLTKHSYQHYHIYQAVSLVPLLLHFGQS